MSTLGVAKGWKQLGLRSVTQPDHSGKVSKAWVLKSAPRYWSMEQVESFLKAADVTEVSFTSKRWEKFGTTWSFRAIRDGSQDYLQLLYEGTDFETESRFVVVERDLRLPKRNQVVPLKPEKSVPLRSGFWEKDSEREKGLGKGVAATQIDESPENDGESNDFDKDQNMEGDSAKRSKAAPLPLGVEKIQNQGEGNCLFLAVSQAIDNSGGGGT